MILRCTKRLLDVLGHDRLVSVLPEPDAEDWYANLVWIERRKCLLLTHSGTLFSVFSPDVRAGALRTTGTLFAQLVATALADEACPVTASATSPTTSSPSPRPSTGESSAA